MRFVSVAVVAVFISGTAGAQSSKAPSVCAAGYTASVKQGRMAKLDGKQLKSIDTDNNGQISKAEFDVACAAKLIK